MYYLFYGDDTYRSRQALSDLLIDKKNQHIEFDVPSEDTALLNGYIHGASLFGEKVFVMRYPLSGANDIREYLKENLLFLKENKNLFILWEGSLDQKKKSFLEIFKKNAEKVFVFPFLENSQLKKYVEKIAKEKQCEISEKEIKNLCDNFGGDLWAIVGELEKYFLTKTFSYKSRVEIQEKLYEFTDALAEKNHSRAHELLEGVQKAGFEVPYIVATLGGIVRNMLKIKSALQYNPDYRMLEEFGMHPFVLKKTLLHVRHHRLEKLRDLYKKILASDILAKTSDTEPHVLLTRLVAEF